MSRFVVDNDILSIATFTVVCLLPCASRWLQLVSFALVDKLIPIFYTSCLKSSNTGRPIIYNDFQFLFPVVATCSPRPPTTYFCFCFAERDYHVKKRRREGPGF